MKVANRDLIICEECKQLKPINQCQLGMNFTNSKQGETVALCIDCAWKEV